MHHENKILIEKLKILELENPQTLDSDKLKQLEKFYYKALDKTKDIKFLQKYSQVIPAGVVPSPSSKILWEKLEISAPPENLQYSSEDSSLEFESSFYKSKKTTEISIDFNESSINP